MGALADKILAADDLPREEVETPEWASFGAPTLFVRGLTARERDEYERGLLVRLADGTRVLDPNPKNIRAGFVARVVVDADGERVFSDQQIAELGGKNAAVVDRLWLVGRRLSGMIVEAEENPSTGDQEGSSSSDSPLPSASLIQTD